MFMRGGFLPESVISLVNRAQLEAPGRYYEVLENFFAFAIVDLACSMW